MLLGGWTWVAAASLIGFEAFDILFGAFVLAPELLPLVIIALALGWYFRERIRAVIRRWRIRARAARVARIHSPARPARPIEVDARTDVRLR